MSFGGLYYVTFLIPFATLFGTCPYSVCHLKYVSLMITINLKFIYYLVDYLSLYLSRIKSRQFVLYYICCSNVYAAFRPLVFAYIIAIQKKIPINIKFFRYTAYFQKYLSLINMFRQLYYYPFGFIIANPVYIVIKHNNLNVTIVLIHATIQVLSKIIYLLTITSPVYMYINHTTHF